MKILFLRNAPYNEITYIEGEVHDLREDLAYRWLNRGLATNDPEAIAKAEAAKAPPVFAVDPATVKIVDQEATAGASQDSETAAPPTGSPDPFPASHGSPAMGGSTEAKAATPRKSKRR